ncbi:MAG: DUF2752 domain-containing protein [Flavobacteriaceae bacterium]|nr:DUF2752 domain-containing protein [Flavobacteriaceae bacterium]
MKLKTIGLLFIGMIIAILYFYFNRSTFFLKCPLYTTTGVYCPGCGSQRAFHSLLHLNFKEVIQYNILFLAGIILGVYHYSIFAINFLFSKKFKSILSQKKAPIIILMLVIVFWFLRNIPVYPFTILAPK